MAAFVSTAVHREWLTVDDWANVDWRDRVPLALGNENSFDAFEPVADERTLLREPSCHHSSRVVSPGGYVSNLNFSILFFFLSHPS